MITMNATDRMAHLSDGADVVAPLALLGHYRRDDPRVDLAIATYHADLGIGTHPYHGREAVLVQDESDRTLLVAVDRLAHARGCAECEPVWQRFDHLADEFADDENAMITALVRSDATPVLLLVDAMDVDVRSSGQ